jgi:hypothetical protein
MLAATFATDQKQAATCAVPVALCTESRVSVMLRQLSVLDQPPARGRSWLWFWRGTEPYICTLLSCALTSCFVACIAD